MWQHLNSQFSLACAASPLHVGCAASQSAAEPHLQQQQQQQQQECFLTPDERRMALSEFFHLLRSSRQRAAGRGAPEVPYIQVSQTLWVSG